MFAGGLDFSIPVKRFFYEPMYRQKAFVDTVVSLTGFALVGGPARQDAPKAVTALKALNVPYLVSLPLVFQTTEEWMDSDLGVHPVQVALQVPTLPVKICAWDPAAPCHVHLSPCTGMPVWLLDGPFRGAPTWTWSVLCAHSGNDAGGTWNACAFKQHLCIGCGHLIVLTSLCISC